MLDVEGSLENTGCKKAISWNTGCKSYFKEQWM
jgi:hypothetical protein